MRKLIDTINNRFIALDRRSREFIRLVPEDKIYAQPRASADTLFPVYSCGEYLLRSAGAVEQASNGLATKLWDDPFEWTLPEELSTVDKILGYLNEVEAARVRTFAMLASDDDLYREIPAPEKLKDLFNILLETMARAENYQGRAFAAFRFFSDVKLPRF
jgi:hypothetical protein